MLEKIRAQFEDDLAKIHEAVQTSSVNEIQERVMTAIVNAKKNADKSFQQFEIANTQADEVVDPHVEKILRSKWTALIVAVGTLIAVSVGVVIGMHL